MSIQITLDGLSIYSHELEIEINFDFVDNQIPSEAIKQLTILALKSKGVNVYIATSHFLAVPQSLYQQQVKSKYLECIKVDTTNYQPVINQINGVVCISQIAQNIFTKLNQIFVEIDYHHQIELLIEKGNESSSSIVLANCTNGVLSIVHFNSGELELATAVEYRTIADVAYYLAPYAIKKAEQEESEIVVSCNKAELEQLQKLFPNIKSEL